MNTTYVFYSTWDLIKVNALNIYHCWNSLMRSHLSRGSIIKIFEFFFFVPDNERKVEILVWNHSWLCVWSITYLTAIFFSMTDFSFVFSVLFTVSHLYWLVLLWFMDIIWFWFLFLWSIISYLSLLALISIFSLVQSPFLFSCFF